jgi:hypothetical protein
MGCGLVEKKVLKPLKSMNGTMNSTIKTMNATMNSTIKTEKDLISSA